MRVICGSRRTGKTTKLIELCDEAEKQGEVSYIVCHSSSEARRIANMAKHLNKVIGFPITFDELQKGQLAGQNIKNLYIDNAEYLLSLLIPYSITGITINCEAVE